MSKLKLFGVFFAAIALAGSQPASARALPDTGAWTIRSARAADLTFELRVTTSHGSDTWGADVPLDRLKGLSRSELLSSGATVNFDVVRDAGTLHCAGHIASGSGSGTFRFVPSSMYARRLAALAVASPTVGEQRQMAYGDVSLGFVETLRENQYVIRQPAELIRMTEHGVSSQFVATLSELGYYLNSGESVVRLVDHGVSIGYIEALRRLGYRPTALELVRSVDHGVSATFVEASTSLVGRAPLEEFVRMVDHGVTTDFVHGFVSMGYRPTTEQLVSLADHGVDVNFARKTAARGKAASIEDLIRLRDTGEH